MKMLWKKKTRIRRTIKRLERKKKLKCLPSRFLLFKYLPPFCNLLQRPPKKLVEHHPLHVSSTIHSTRVQVHLIHDMLEVTKTNILRLGVDVVPRDDGRVKLLARIRD